MSRPAKGHKGRQRKLECSGCGFIAYASRGAIERAGVPMCGCGEPLTVANVRDLIALDMVDYREVSSDQLRAEGLGHLRKGQGTRHASHWRRCTQCKTRRAQAKHHLCRECDAAPIPF
jgi:hypothetical protein